MAKIKLSDLERLQQFKFNASSQVYQFRGYEDGAYRYFKVPYKTKYPKVIQSFKDKEVIIVNELQEKKIVKDKVKPAYNDKGKPTFKIRDTAGVYIIFRKDKAVYVGFSKTNVYKTMYRHFQRWEQSTQRRVLYDPNDKNIRVRVIYVNTPLNADRLEKALIIKLKPSDNIQQYWINYDLDQKEKDIYDLYTQEKVKGIVKNDLTHAELVDIFGI